MRCAVSRPEKFSRCWWISGGVGRMIFFSDKIRGGAKGVEMYSVSSNKKSFWWNLYFILLVSICTATILYCNDLVLADIPIEYNIHQIGIEIWVLPVDLKFADNFWSYSTFCTAIDKLFNAVVSEKSLFTRGYLALDISESNLPLNFQQRAVKTFFVCLILREKKSIGQHL